MVIIAVLGEEFRATEAQGPRTIDTPELNGRQKLKKTEENRNFNSFAQSRYKTAATDIIGAIKFTRSSFAEHIPKFPKD
jgi:hypothetical protein